MGTGFLEFPAAYMMGACVIGMIAMLFVKECRRPRETARRRPRNYPVADMRTAR